MKTIINQHTQPLPLDDGTILAAAGTPGSEREVEGVSERDQRRYLRRGLIAFASDAAAEAAGGGDPAAASHLSAANFEGTRTKAGGGTK